MTGGFMPTQSPRPGDNPWHDDHDTQFPLQGRVEHSPVAAATTRMPRGGDPKLQLSLQTLAWLARRSHARKLVHLVWSKLSELERAGHCPEAIIALRRILIDHQPTSRGRCRTCRRWTGRRYRFPCIVWHQVRSELLE
jgi:hypothetical protein